MNHEVVKRPVRQIEVEGGLADEWKKAFNDLADKEEVDIALALSTAALAIKDETERQIKQHIEQHIEQQIEKHMS